MITSSGQMVTFAELEERSCRLAQALHAHGLPTGDHVAVRAAQRRPHARGGVRPPALRPLLHHGQHAPDRRGGGLHRRTTAAPTRSSPRRRVGAAGRRHGRPHPRHRPAARRRRRRPSSRGPQRLRRVRRARPRPRRSTTSSRASPCCTRRAPPATPRASAGRSTDEPFGTSATLVPMLEGIMGFNEGDVYLSPAPLYHSAPLVWSMTMQRMGGTVVVMDRFDPEPLPPAHRRAQGDPRAVRADHVRPHAQAARRGTHTPTTSRPCAPSCTPPRPARPRSSGG